jgi:hypothetical protein
VKFHVGFDNPVFKDNSTILHLFFRRLPFTSWIPG